MAPHALLEAIDSEVLIDDVFPLALVYGIMLSLLIYLIFILCITVIL